MSYNSEEKTFREVFKEASTKLKSYGGQGIIGKLSETLNFLNSVASICENGKKFDTNSNHKEILDFFNKHKNKLNEHLITRKTGATVNNLRLWYKIVDFLTNLNKIHNNSKIENNNNKEYANIQLFLENVINYKKDIEAILSKEETMEKNNNYVTHEEFDPYAQKTDWLLGEIDRINKRLDNIKNNKNDSSIQQLKTYADQLRKQLTGYVNEENNGMWKHIDLLQQQINNLNNNKNSTINNSQITEIQSSLSTIKATLSELQKQVEDNKKNILILQKKV